MNRFRHRDVVIPLLFFTFPLAVGLAGPSPDGPDGEELPVLRRSFAGGGETVPPFPEGRFEPRAGGTISWIGGTEVADLDRHPFLESAIQLTWPDRNLRMRNLAWQGDTVYHQARPRYFYTKEKDSQPGSLADHRERTEPGIVFLAFGKMESLDGAERLPGFVAAYAKLLDDLAPLTKRLVLVRPTPFFRSGPAAALADERNAVLDDYARAIRTLAEERGLRYLDFPADEWDAEMSDNGVHLNEAGHRLFAAKVLAALGYPEVAREEPPAALRDAIVRKNLLWQQYYRPSNWAFLFGDRQHVPASRDDKNRDERWLVREIDVLPGLIAEAENDIHRYARETVK